MTHDGQIKASGTVHWLGTGLSTGSGLGVLTEAAKRVVVWGRSEDKAERCLERLGLRGRASVRTYDISSLAGDLRAGDVVVSMLPATEHAELVRLCVERSAHFACSSYASDEILAEVPAAAKGGVTVLTEAGLDPGIDHLFARGLVAKAVATIGESAATARFTSYCGGIPAVLNDFRYRFSWAPLGVLNALRTPARYVDEGLDKVASSPWEATRPLVLGGEEFEVYPNRDSLPYLAQYAIPRNWRMNTFVRGTLRPAGWRRAWADVFAELSSGDTGRIARLAGELAERYPTTEADRDRVVLAVALDVQGDGGAAWSGEYLLDLLGDAGESAMARCVSLPLAYGVTEILDGNAHPGLGQAGHDAESIPKWLEFLSSYGIPFRFREREA